MGDLRLSGRIAVVTGGGRGLGSELVRALAGEGADVAFSCRESRRAALEEAEAAAALGEAFDVNVKAAAMASRAAAPHMRRRGGGAIVNVASLGRVVQVSFPIDRRGRGRSSTEVNMTVTREDDKPWKTDLARKAALRREQVGQELEDVIKKATSFEEALRQAVELMKKRFARYAAVTAYVADGEALAVHIALERPQGPDRVASSGGPVADAAQGQNPTVFSDLSASPTWAAVGLTSGSAMVAPVRTEAGLWAILEVWSDFRDAFAPPDVKLLGKVAQALAKKTPAA